MQEQSTNKGFSNLYQRIKRDLNIFTLISFGVFLFILFFQPFSLDKLDFNDRLLFIAGLGAIVFLLLSIVRIFFPGQEQNMNSTDLALRKNSYWAGFIFLILNTVAFSFYLRYVGGVEITFYIVFKIVLLSLALPIIFNVHDLIRTLKMEDEIKKQRIVNLQQEIASFSRDKKSTKLHFVSLNSSDKLEITDSDVILIRSADNYVEIIHKTEGGIKKKMLRNTLKNIEYQLNRYPNFVRSHRTCIINMEHGGELKKSQNSYYIQMNNLDESVPVSRQYLLRVKEAKAVHRDE